MALKMLQGNAPGAMGGRRGGSGRSRRRDGWVGPEGAPSVRARRLQGAGQRGDRLVRLAGIEPTTLGFGGQYSIH